MDLVQKLQAARELALLTARMTWIGASRFAVIAAIGFALDCIFLFCVRHALWSYFSTDISPVMASRAGGPGAILALLVLAIALILKNPLFLGILTVFCVAFPLAYVLVAKAFAISSAISFALRKKQGALARYLVERLLAAGARHPEWSQWLSSGGAAFALERFSERYLRRLDNMPWLLRMVFRRMLAKLDVARELPARLRALGQNEPDPEKITIVAVSLFSEHVTEKSFRPSLRGFGIVAIANVLFAIVIWLGAR